jgi:hypothetical protein
MSDLGNLLERFRRGPELLAAVLTGIYGEEPDYVPSQGRWTIRQIAAHLADSEMVGAFRLRSVIAENNPTLLAFDQDAWSVNLDYAKRKPGLSLETFRRVRAENHELLKDLPEAAFERTGTHSARGVLTLGELVQGYADHAESHARQMQSIREEYKQAKGKK